MLHSGWGRGKSCKVGEVETAQPSPCRGVTHNEACYLETSVFSAGQWDQRTLSVLSPLSIRPGSRKSSKEVSVRGTGTPSSPSDQF